MFLELLKKYQEQYDIKIFAYVLMPDHLHLLVEMTGPAKGGQLVKSQEISDFMQNLNNAYTKYFNSAYDRKGHLFRERFKAAIVEKDNYLLKMTVYLHLNPQKLNFTADARTYPYSSYPLYLGNEPACAGNLNLKEEIAEIFSLLGETNYADFVNAVTAEESESFHKRLARGGILGSDEFVKRVRSHIQEYQSQDNMQEPEPAPDSYRLFVTSGALVLIFAASVAAGTYFYFVHNKPKLLAQGKVIPAAIRTPRDLNNTEWQIKLTPAGEGSAVGDTLTFKDGKLISARFDYLGFTPSNCSMAVESSGKVIWETMQTTDKGTVNWHGEIEQGKMRGIVSLRQEGKPTQDFSFLSTGKWRKK
jgi:putative transposase